MSDQTLLIDITQIDVDDRLRNVDTAWAEAIATSMLEAGQLTPVSVRSQVGGRYSLLDGGHRMAALGIAGIETVYARVMAVDDLQARLIEIDSNLFRNELNALDRAVFLAERKSLYEELHPETKKGVAGAKSKHGSANVIFTFAKDVAARTGLSASTIQQSVQLYSRLTPDVRRKIAGTRWADRQSDLRLLSQQSAAMQGKIADLLFSGETPARSMREAIARVEGRSVIVNDDARQLAVLLDRWSRAGAGVKADFLRAVGAEITPEKKAA